jgi:capsular polysaccharide biosynthesis protein
MQLIDYVTILRRRWWVILLVSFVAAAAAYGFSKLQTPVYRAEAYYRLQPSQFDNGLTMVLQNSMNSIRDTALARVQMEKISSDLQLDRSPDWLLNKVVSMQALPQDWRMIVRVDYPEEPDVAVKLADAVGKNMIALVTQQNSQVEGSSKIYMTEQQPAFFVGLTKPNTRINVLAGAILGGILGLLLAFLVEALDNTLKTPKDVERFVGLTTLGTIPTVGADRSGAGRRRLAKDDRRPTTA